MTIFVNQFGYFLTDYTRAFEDVRALFQKNGRSGKVTLVQRTLYGIILYPPKPWGRAKSRWPTRNYTYGQSGCRYNCPPCHTANDIPAVMVIVNREPLSPSLSATSKSTFSPRCQTLSVIPTSNKFTQRKQSFQLRLPPLLGCPKWSLPFSGTTAGDCPSCGF